ncbi:MAG: thermonuclease family protein [Alphaproteobacteria bacterium]|nr:thermonuclease family protein [Alphaproteobacteria bacterium]
MIDRRNVVFGLLGLPAAAMSGHAARPGPTLPAGFIMGGRGRVTTVLSGDRLNLDDGTQIRLAGVQAPTLGTGTARAEPLAADVSNALGRMLVGHYVDVHLPTDPTDRWGRTVAHLVRADDGLWVQGALLSRGLTRVRTFPGTATGARAMLELERTARAGRLGLWAHRHFRVRNPGETWGDLDSFQVVEGRVVDAAVVRGTGYLNFGRDWRRDFTLRLKPRVRTLFDRAGLDPRALAGQRVRSRGWVFPTNGPMIDLTHVEQLEVLEE